MTKASDNDYPSILLTEQGSAPTSPAASHQRLYIRTSDHKLVTVNSSGTVAPVDAGGGAGSGNLWSMNKSSSQTLTSSTDTKITFDTTLIDGGSSTIDLANDKFETPATGFYIAYAVWLWETTAPVGGAAAIAVYVGGAATAVARCRVPGTPIGDGGYLGVFPLSLTAGDDVELYINPGGATPTARGNAAKQIATTFTLLRVT